MENLELWKNIAISMVVAILGTGIGGYLLRLTLRKAYNLAVSRIHVAEEKNMISSATAEKATQVVENGLGILQAEILALKNDVKYHNVKIDELIAYYQKREERLLELINTEFGVDIND